MLPWTADGLEKAIPAAGLEVFFFTFFCTLVFDFLQIMLRHSAHV